MNDSSVKDTLPGQRRWVAIMFADLVDSTEVAEQIGAENFYGLMREVLGEAWAVVERYHGHTVEFGGDSLLVTFGAPVAVENASINACRTALAIQAFVADSQGRFEEQFGHAPQLRIGLAGGIVTVGDLSINEKLGLNVLGSAVNKASRVEGLAAAGEILMSSKIYDQVVDLVAVEPMGPQVLKGFAEPEPVFRLTEIKALDDMFKQRLRRGAKSFAGRLEELDALGAWARKADGTARVVDMIGPAGIGKSRLIYELGLSLGEDVALVCGQCDLERQSSSYFPLIGLIRDYLNWSTDQPIDLLESRIADKFADDLAKAGAFVDMLAGAANVSVDADLENAIEIRDGLSRVLKLISASPDVAMIIEDTHWLDPTSAELLRELALAGELQIATTRRPGGKMTHGIDQPVLTLLLEPITGAPLAEIVASVLGVDNVPDDLLEFVLKASEGMPLFAEEVVQFLRQDGQIEFGAEDGVAFHPKDGALDEAGNLQNLIMSLFDSLSADAKHCLQFAATKGRRFSVAFLEACVSNKEVVRDAVDEVINLGIVSTDPSIGPQGLRFSHALFSESIYQSFLESNRRQLHGQVATALEFDDESTAAERAFHFDNGGQNDKAVRHYWQAANDAMAVYAVDIADRKLEQAFQLIEADGSIIDDTDYGEILVLHGRALDIFGNFRRLDEIMESRLLRLAAGGPSRNYVICLTLQALSRCHGAKYEQAKGMIQLAGEISDQLGDESASAWVKTAKMRIYHDTETATHAEIEEIYRDVRPITERLGDRHLIQASMYNLLASYRSIGDMKKADALAHELETFGRDHNDSRAIAYSQWARAVQYFLRRDANALRESTANVLRHAIPGTADWRVATVYQVAVGLLEAGTGPDPDLFTPHLEKTRAFEDFTLHHAAWVGRMLACFKTGQIARGRREMIEMKKDFPSTATNELQRAFIIYQSEILLAVSGLKPSSGPRPKLGFADLVAFLSMRLFARKRAQRLLESYLEITPAKCGPLLAQAHHGLGLIALSRSNTTKAREHLKKAVTLYTEQSFDTAVTEVQAALERV